MNVEFVQASTGSTECLRSQYSSLEEVKRDVSDSYCPKHFLREILVAELFQKEGYETVKVTKGTFNPDYRGTGKRSAGSVTPSGSRRSMICSLDAEQEFEPIRDYMEELFGDRVCEKLVRKGLPDLLVYKLIDLFDIPSEMFFVEVKSESDTLNAEQKSWIEDQDEIPVLIAQVPTDDGDT